MTEKNALKMNLDHERKIVEYLRESDGCCHQGWATAWMEKYN